MERQTSTHCKNGHERTPGNLYKGGNCKKCMQLARLMKVMNVTAVEDIVKSSKLFIPQTHCLRGHERTPNNVEKAGGCKECAKLHDKARRLKAIKPMIVTCRHGHERTPENTYKNGKCKLCQSIWNKKYLQKPEGKARQAAAKKAYLQKPESKARHAAAMKTYLQNPENKARHAANMKAYQKTEKRQAYLNSEHGKKLERIRTRRKQEIIIKKRIANEFDWIPSDVWKIAA